MDGPPMVKLEFSCSIDESASSRDKRRELERKIRKERREREEQLIISREEQARGEAGKIKKKKREEDDDDDDEDEDEEDDDDEENLRDSKKRQRRRVTYEDDDEQENDDGSGGASKSQERAAARGRKLSSKNNARGENRSFFPNGQHPNSSKTGALGGGAPGGSGSNDALVRSLLAQSLKQPLRNKNGFSSVEGRPGLDGYYQPNATGECFQKSCFGLYHEIFIYMSILQIFTISWNTLFLLFYEHVFSTCCFNYP